MNLPKRSKHLDRGTFMVSRKGIIGFKRLDYEVVSWLTAHIVHLKISRSQLQNVCEKPWNGSNL